jgi:drug/metabolite transporter (DMT)-like permease
MTVVAGISKKGRSYFYAGAAILLWSLGAYFCCLLCHLPLLQLIGISMTAGGAISLLIERRRCSVVSIKHHLATRWIGTLLMLLNQLAYVSAFRLAPAAQVDLINYLWPSLLVVGEVVRTRRGLNGWQIVGLLTCLLALIVLLFPVISFKSFGLEHGKGYLTAFLAALSWALYSLLGKSRRYSSGEGPFVSVDLLISGVVCSVASFLTTGFVVPSSSELLVVLLLGVGVYGLAFPCWQRALKLGSCTSIGGLANAIPILSVGCLIVGGVAELSISLIAAGLLVIFGCFLLGISKGRRRTVTVTLETDESCSDGVEELSNPSSGFIPLNFSVFCFIYAIFLVTCRPTATGFLGICRI